MLTYTATDALVTTGLFVILAHLSRWLSLRPRAGAALMTVGAYSYGLYLLHQPYVTYAGERLRDLNVATFVPIALALTALLAVATIPLERWTNRAVSAMSDER
jgi:peptidoglycan/LPS O-acetylase OafA/YrhL